jgi:hypothetical protein
MLLMPKYLSQPPVNSKKNHVFTNILHPAFNHTPSRPNPGKTRIAMNGLAYPSAECIVSETYYRVIGRIINIDKPILAVVIVQVSAVVGQIAVIVIAEAIGTDTIVLVHPVSIDSIIGCYRINFHVYPVE